MLRRSIIIINKLGLHARAAAKLVALAGQFECEVRLVRNHKEVNGKSILGVMMLAAAKDTTLEIITDGADEESAMQALVDLVERRFDEGE